jgi:hypothetical protein
MEAGSTLRTHEEAGPGGTGTSGIPLSGCVRRRVHLGTDRVLRNPVSTETPVALPPNQPACLKPSAVPLTPETEPVHRSSSGAHGHSGWPSLWRPGTFNHRPHPRRLVAVPTLRVPGFGAVTEASLLAAAVSSSLSLLQLELAVPLRAIVHQE